MAANSLAIPTVYGKFEDFREQMDTCICVLYGKVGFAKI
jgi:hypothetical protein